MTSLTLTIITPSFNQGQFIEETINSVLTQKIPGLDYFVVDGGSSDETVTILKKYQDTLRYVSEPDKGQSHAVNKGITGTHSDIIGWLNSDDIYYENALNTILDFFEKTPDIDILYGMANHIDANGKFINQYPTEPFDPARLLITCYISQPAVFFRRSIVEKCGLLDENLNYCMDYEYWIRLSKNKGIRFHYLPSLLAATRLHDDTKTLGSAVKVHKEINTMLKKSEGSVPDVWLYNYAHVVARQKIDRYRHPILFILSVSLYSLWGSLYWNHRISFSVLKVITQWMTGLLKKRREA